MELMEKLCGNNKVYNGMDAGRMEITQFTMEWMQVEWK
jgi:hypothetical protein